MSTIVQYECRNLEHLRGESRRGNGGFVIHHGSVGYCDGLYVDAAHRWVPTGGVPMELLLDSAPEVDPGTCRTDGGGLAHVRPSASGKMLVEVDGTTRARGDLSLGAKLSDDPDWPDGSPRRVALLHAD